MKNAFRFIFITILLFYAFSFLRTTEIYASIPNPSLNIADSSQFTDCTLITNQWNSCGSINYADCANNQIANYWVTCYVDGNGTLSSCTVSNPEQKHDGSPTAAQCPTPPVAPTCNSTCMPAGADTACAPAGLVWKPGTSGICTGTDMCGQCVTPTPGNPTATPTDTPTPTNGVPPPSGSCPPAQVCNGANASNCCTSGQFCTVGNQGTNVCQNNFAPPPNNPPPNNPPATNPPINTQPPAQPTATPTPPFDQSMCSCDGLNFSSIVAGQPVSVTAYGKVLSANTQYATIPSFDFFFYQGSGTKATIVTNATEKASIFATLPDKVRFKSDWTLNVPANIDPTLTYRIQAKPTCVRKTAMISNLQENRVVLGASTDNSLWGRIVAFFTDLFGGGGKTQPTNQTNNFVTNYSAVTPTEAPKKQNLQLDTFHPANILDSDNCSFIKFGF